MNFIKPKMAWFLAFTAVFAALAGYVFWGTWSMDFAPVMPDDPYRWSSYTAEAWSSFWKSLISSGKLIPTDAFWSGLIVSPYFCQELKYVSGVFLSGVGLAYFLRGRGLSALASYGAGLLLAFCGYWFTLFSAGHGGWFIVISYIIFEFGFTDRAVRLGKMRYWMLLGLFESWAGFNQQDLWLLFSLLVVAYVVWCCVRERKFPWKGLLVALAVFTLVGLPNFRLVLRDTIKGRVDQIARGENITQQGANVSDADKRWEFVTNWSMPFEDTIEFFDARVHGDTSCPFVLSINGPKGVRPYVGALGRPLNAKSGNYRQHSLYVGFITVILAFVGIIFGIARRSGEVIFFSIAALVFYLFSLGRYFEPAYRLIFSLPAGDLIRCPVKWHHLTEFCLVVLAGYGIDSLKSLKWFNCRRGALILGALVIIGAANLAFEAKRFCAPVNYGAARRTNSTMQMSVITRQQFQDPQIAASVRAGRIVSLANYLGHPDYFLVGVLSPYTPTRSSLDWVSVSLGIVSLLTAFGVLVLGFKRNVES